MTVEMTEATEHRSPCPALSREDAAGTLPTVHRRTSAEGGSAKGGSTKGGPAERDATEGELAQIWADALGTPDRRLHAGDDGPGSGDTSWITARLVIALGQRLSLSELAGNATLARMTGLLEQRHEDTGAQALGA